MEVHALGSLEYSLSNSGGVTVVPGGSGSTNVISTLIAGNPTNVTLSCDLTTLSANLSGTLCSFSPSSVIPTSRGNTTILTITVPANPPCASAGCYGSFNVTIKGANGSPAPIAPTTVLLTVAARVSVDPVATAAKSYIVGDTITINVNATDAPASSGFLVGVFYNNSVLQFQSLDYAGGVLGDSPFLSSECSDGVGTQCIADPTYDGVGVVSLDLATGSGANTTSAPNGKMFSLTFKVAALGFSALHFVHQQIFSHHLTQDNPLNTMGFDGYFTNVDCPIGSGFLCKPPSVSIVPPVRPVEFRTVTFNSTASSLNPGGHVREYNWTFGSIYLIYVNSPVRNQTITGSANVTFPNIGEWLVTLSVQDNYGARAYLTISVVVFRVWTDLGVLPIDVDHTVGILPGTVVHIVASAFNNGVSPENSTLRLSINGQNITTQPVMNLQTTGIATLNYTWQTTGLSPRVYEIDVSLDEVRDRVTGHILENDTSITQGRLVDRNNAKSAFVQIISPVPGNFGLFLGLNLPETLGLAIVVVAVAGFVFGIIKKARAPPPEPL